MDSILIIAGENSGEKYGADLVREFKKNHPPIQFFGIGGKEMEKEGVYLLYHLNEIAVVGVVEIISQLPRINKIMTHIKKQTKDKKPLAAVLIDSPDFNLRLAKNLKKLNIPILYYISPTVWAWRKKRLKKIRKTVDKMMVIFPFEEKLYKEENIPVVYIGHPLKERINLKLTREEFCQKYGLDPQKNLISILPGSRRSEMKYHMPTLAKATSKIKKRYQTQNLWLLAENLERRTLSSYLSSNEEAKILQGDHYEAMAFSKVALSSCGTANLEAALLGTPLISFYRLSPLTYHVGVKFIKINNYSIVNILANKMIIPELIQKQFSPENIFKETAKILESNRTPTEMKDHFHAIKDFLGDKIASKNAAQELKKIISR